MGHRSFVDASEADDRAGLGDPVAAVGEFVFGEPAQVRAGANSGWVFYRVFVADDHVADRVADAEGAVDFEIVGEHQGDGGVSQVEFGTVLGFETGSHL